MCRAIDAANKWNIKVCGVACVCVFVCDFGHLTHSWLLSNQLTLNCESFLLWWPIYLGEETIIENEDGTDEGWVETHHFDASANEVEDRVRDMTLDGNKNDNDIAGDMEEEMNRAAAADGDDDDDEEAADMEDFEESGMLDAVDPVSFFPYFLMFHCSILSLS